MIAYMKRPRQILVTFFMGTLQRVYKEKTYESTLAIYHLYQKKVVRANSVRACSVRDLIV